MDSEEDLIELHLCTDKILVWKAEDVKMIREEHNIVGKLVGCLPRSPNQNLQLSLPLQLMPEEAAVLIEYGVARIINMKVKTPTVEDTQEFEKNRLKSFKEQNVIIQLDKEYKKMEILKNNQSVYGKKKKQLRKEKAKRTKMLLSGKQEKDVEKVITQLETTGPITQLSMDGMRQSSVDCETRNLRSEDGIDNTAMNKQEENIGVSAIDNDIKCCKRGIDNSDVVENSKKQKLMKEQDEGNKTEEDFEHCQESKVNIAHNIDVSLLQSEYKGTEDTHKSMHIECESNTIKEFGNNAKNIDKADQDVKSDVMQKSQSNEKTVKENKPIVKKTSESAKNEMEESSTSKQYQGSLILIPTCATKYDKIPIEEWNFPSSVAEWLRYRVFKDFWEQGYFLTSGGKFGGDFLVYPGNPMLFHSSYIAICLPHTESFNARELVQFGRMASNVRKTVVLCSLDKHDKLVFTSIQWTGIS